MKVINRAKLSTAELARIEIEVAEHSTLDDVLKWGFAQPASVVHPHIITEVIVQDEYSHDVIVPWRDELVLIFGTTWLGAVTAVAVWDHHPSADELLDARVSGGWKPTPSRMKGGDRIMGHAACLVTESHAREE